MKCSNQLDCDWIDIGCIFLQQGATVLINSIKIVTNVTYPSTISNSVIPACSIPTEKTGKCITNTPCIFQVEANEIIGVQNSKLVTLPTVHLKSKVKLGQALLTLINLSHNVLYVMKYILLGTLR